MACRLVELGKVNVSFGKSQFYQQNVFHFFCNNFRFALNKVKDR